MNGSLPDLDELNAQTAGGPTARSGAVATSAAKPELPDLDDLNRQQELPDIDDLNRHQELPDLDDLNRQQELPDIAELNGEKKPEQGSVAGATVKGAIEGLAEGAWEGAKAGLAKATWALPKVVTGLERAAGNLINLGGNAPNKVGNLLVNDANEADANYEKWMPTSTAERLGYEDWGTKTGDFFGNVAAMAVKFAPATATGGATAAGGAAATGGSAILPKVFLESVLASDGVNAYADTRKIADENGADPVFANFLGGLSGLVNYFGGKALMASGGVAKDIKNPLLRELVTAAASGGALGAQGGANKAITNAAEGKPIGEGVVGAVGEGFAEGFGFHAANMIPRIPKLIKETDDHYNFAKNKIIDFAQNHVAELNQLMDTPETAAALEARKAGGDITDEAAKAMGLPKNMKQKERNAVADALLNYRNSEEAKAAEAARIAAEEEKVAQEQQRVAASELRGKESVAEQMAGIEEMGVGSWEDAEAKGLTEKDETGAYRGGARQAINIAIHGTDKLKGAVKSGAMSGDTAEAILTTAQCELGARPVEDRAALVDAIVDKAGGDEALAKGILRKLTEEEVAGGPATAEPLGAETIEQRVERAAQQVKAEAIAARNGVDEATARSVSVEPVETADGRLTTVGDQVAAEIDLHRIVKEAGEREIKWYHENGGITPGEFRDLLESIPMEIRKEMDVNADLMKLLKTQSKAYKKLQDRRTGNEEQREKTKNEREIAYGRAAKATAEAVKAFAKEKGFDVDKTVVTEETAKPKPQTALEGFENAERLKGTELKVTDNGTMTCNTFPELRLDVSQDGVSVRGITPETMAKPANAADAAAVVARAYQVAKRNGVKLVFESEAAAKTAAGLMVEVQREQLARAQKRLDTRAKMFDLLLGNGLGTHVTFDFDNFKKALEASETGRRFINQAGDIYAFEDGKGGIHFNPQHLRMDTAFHEYGHLARAVVEKVNPSLWKRGMDLIGETEYFREIAEMAKGEKHPYHGLDEAALREEAICNLLGDRGAKIIESKGAGAELKAWIREFWKAIKDALGIADLTEEQIEKMTLEEIADAVNSELLRGREFGKRTKPSGLSRRQAALKRMQSQEDAYWEQKAEAEEEAARQAYIASGGTAMDYVKSRAMESEASLDLNWEAMRELANDVAEGRFQARRMIGGKETAVSEGYPLSLRDSRDPEKVLHILCPLIGKSVAQIGQMKLTRITDKSIEHLMNSQHARHWQRIGGKEGKRLWRGTVAGMSVTDDIIGTSHIGSEQTPKHQNADWKKNAKFYQADTRFAVELDNGQYEIYPCKLIVSEINGERQVYDITEIGKPTLTASSTLVNANLVPGVNAPTGTPGSKYTGESADPTAGSITKTESEGQGAKFQAMKPEEIDMSLFTWKKPGENDLAMGDTEQNAAGIAAGIEKKEALRPWTKKMSPADQAKPIAFDAADMVMFWRAVSGALRNPVIKKGDHIPGHKNWLGMNRGGDYIELASKLFGIVDTGDIERLKAGCVKDGYFRHLDDAWRSIQSKLSIRNEQNRSEAELDRRTRELYEKRVTTGEGGEHYATQVLGHEIGHTLAKMPADKNLGPIGNDLKTLFDAMKGKMLRHKDPLMKKGETSAMEQVRQLIAWWHGTEKMPEYYEKPEERFAELFGIFLTQPESVQSMAPKAYDICVDAIAKNEKLTKAYRHVAELKWKGQSNDAVMKRLRATWEADAQKQYRKLADETKESVSSWKDAFNYALNDRFGPLFGISKRGIRAEKARLDQAVKEGKMSEQEATDRLGDMKAETDAMRTSLYNWQRQSGGSTRLMISHFDEVKYNAEKAGVSWEDVRDYAHLMRVIEVGGRATAHGIDPARAAAILGDMARRLGPEKWAGVEKTAKAFRACYESDVLDDPNVKELFDDMTNKMLAENKHYVTMKHRMGVEEAADWQKRIEEYRKGNRDAWDPCIDIQTRLNRGLGGAGGEGGGGFVLHRLVGSFEATEDPLAATIKRAIEIKEAAARNHLIKQTSETLRACGAKGVFDSVVKNGGGHAVDPEVYGKLFYMDKGVKHELIVPKIVWMSFKGDTHHFDNWFTNSMGFIRNTMTLWNPGFVKRAHLIDKNSVETNIEGMRKPVVDIVAEAIGNRFISAPLYMINNYGTRFTKISKTWWGKILWPEKTFNNDVLQAQKIARMAYEGRFGEHLDEARRLRGIGENGKAAEIEQNVAHCQEMMRRNIFQSKYQFFKTQKGLSTDDILKAYGYRIGGDAAANTWYGRTWQKIKAAAQRGIRFEEEQEAVPKIVAYLYELKRDEAAGRFGEAAAQARARKVIEYGGTPNLSARGVWASNIENALGFFWNVRKEGSLRTLRAIKDHPTEWMTKNLAQTAFPALLKALMLTGGLNVLIRKLFDDDEEKIKRSWWAASVINYTDWYRYAMKCVPGYYQQNYNVVPLAQFGNHVLTMRLKYSPEEFAIQNAVHVAMQKLGHDPTDPSADWSTLTKHTWEEFLPEIFGSNYLAENVGMIVGPLVGVNPYDKYRQRNVYDKTTWNARWDAPGHMVTEIGKNLWNYSPLGTFTTTFKNGQERKLDENDVPAWLDAVLKTPFVRMIPASTLAITSSDSYDRAIKEVEQRKIDACKIEAEEVLSECIANGVLGGFERKLGDLPPEMRVIAIRHVINGWRQYHADPQKERIKKALRMKDPYGKRKVFEFIKHAELYGD